MQTFQQQINAILYKSSPNELLIIVCPLKKQSNIRSLNVNNAKKMKRFFLFLPPLNTAFKFKTNAALENCQSTMNEKLFAKNVDKVQVHALFQRIRIDGFS